MNPQAHASDLTSLAETPPAAGEQVRTVRARHPDASATVTPVTLGRGLARRRHRRPTPHPLHRSLFGAAWTLAMAAHLAKAGAGSATFFEGCESSGCRSAAAFSRCSMCSRTCASAPAGRSWQARRDERDTAALLVRRGSGAVLLPPTFRVSATPGSARLRAGKPAPARRDGGARRHRLAAFRAERHAAAGARTSRWGLLRRPGSMARSRRAVNFIQALAASFNPSGGGCAKWWHAHGHSAALCRLRRRLLGALSSCPAGGKSAASNRVAIYNRTPEKAEAVARQFGIPAVFDDPDACCARSGRTSWTTSLRSAATSRSPCSARSIACRASARSRSPRSYRDAAAIVGAFRADADALLRPRELALADADAAAPAVARAGAIGMPLRARLTMVSGFDVFANQPALRDWISSSSPISARTCWTWRASSSARRARSTAGPRERWRRA